MGSSKNTQTSCTTNNTMAEQSPYSNLQKNVNDAFNELEADESVYIPEREAEELFNLPDSVHIFFITASGKVSTFSEPSTLRIFDLKRPVKVRPTHLYKSEDGHIHCFLEPRLYLRPVMALSCFLMCMAMMAVVLAWSLPMTPLSML